MLTIKPPSRQRRALPTGPPDAPTGAVLVEDDKLRVAKVTVDFLNGVVFAHLERGHVSAGAWQGSGEIVTVQLDQHTHHDDARRRDTWGQLNAGELGRALAAIEDIIRKAALLDIVQRQPGDPPDPT